MVKQCLQNSPSRRPTTEQLVTDLHRVKNDIEGAYGELTKLDAVRQVVIMKTLKGREAEVREKANEVLVKEEEIHHLQQQLEECHVREAAPCIDCTADPIDINIWCLCIHCCYYFSKFQLHTSYMSL